MDGDECDVFTFGCFQDVGRGGGGGGIMLTPVTACTALTNATWFIFLKYILVI